MGQNNRSISLYNNGINMVIVCYVSHFGLSQCITGKFVRSMFARGEKETFIIFQIFLNGSQDLFFLSYRKYSMTIETEIPNKG